MKQKSEKKIILKIDQAELKISVNELTVVTGKIFEGTVLFVFYFVFGAYFAVKVN